MNKLVIVLLMLVISGASMASYYFTENHTHSSDNQEALGHSGRTDSNGGHNCSEASKRKGLCTGYHYH